MQKQIYMIENKINGKKYIGQSNDVKRRWSDHCNKKEKYTSLINRAINKYGKENFIFSIIEDFCEDYNEKEKYWINFYNSIENGYNIAPGGENPPLHIGEKHPLSKITQKDAVFIQNKLIEGYDIKKILKMNSKFTYDIISHINDGTAWHDEKLSYPILSKKKKAMIIKKLIIKTDLTLTEIANMTHSSKSRIKAINTGQNYKDPNLNYPLRLYTYKGKSDFILNHQPVSTSL